MNIPGIPGSPYPTSSATVGRTITERRPQPSTVQAPDESVTPPSRQAAAAPAPVPVQAPPGTDPMLWNVLTAEERTFFAKVGAMGPLTYGRVLTGQLTPPTPDVRGGRLDLKV